MPIAISPPHRNVASTPPQFPTQILDQSAIPGINRRNALKALVMFADLEKPRVGDSAATGGIAHEGEDVVRPIRAAVRQEHYGIIGIQHRHS